MGWERIRLWSRPNNVASWLAAGDQLQSVRTERALFQFQSTNLDVLWVEGTEPAVASSSKIQIQSWVYDLVGAVNKYAQVVAGVVKSYIEGFSYASTGIAWPNGGNRNASYVEFYDWLGLQGMALDDAYTYREADLMSADQYKAASPRWKFNLTNKEYKQYPVTAMGRLLYGSTNRDVFGYYYNNYGWTDLAYVNHVINR